MGGGCGGGGGGCQQMQVQTWPDAQLVRKWCTWVIDACGWPQAGTPARPESSDGRQGTARDEGGRAGGSQVVRHPVAKPREDGDLESGDGWLPTQGSNSIKLSCYWYLVRSPFKWQTFSQVREKKHVSQSSSTCPKSRMKFESCICRSLHVLIHSALTDQYF